MCAWHIVGDDMFAGDTTRGEWRNCGKWENCRPRYIFYKPPPLFFAVALFTLFPVALETDDLVSSGGSRGRWQLAVKLCPIRPLELRKKTNTLVDEMRRRRSVNTEEVGVD